MTDYRIGHGYDVHRLEEGYMLVLGGIKIEYTKGCVAHSDGDVLVHAVCDALLGAAGSGDIGYHFPDTSSEFKGIDSTVLLGRCVELLDSNGYKVGNIDCTLALQKPKILPYIPAMRQRMADVIGIGIDRINVKATTTEKLGFVGREEGVAAHAVALIYKER